MSTRRALTIIDEPNPFKRAERRAQLSAICDPDGRGIAGLTFGFYYASSSFAAGGEFAAMLDGCFRLQDARPLLDWLQEQDAEPGTAFYALCKVAEMLSAELVK